MWDFVLFIDPRTLLAGVVSSLISLLHCEVRNHLFHEKLGVSVPVIPISKACISTPRFLWNRATGCFEIQCRLLREPCESRFEHFLYENGTYGA